MGYSVICIFLLSATLLASVKAKPRADGSSERINDRTFDVEDRQSNRNDEKESRILDLLRLEAGLPNQVGGLPGSPLGRFPGSQSLNRFTGQNVNQRTDRSLLNTFPGPLNGLLGPQGLFGTTPGLIGTKPNLIGGQSGLLAGLPGLVAGTTGLGNTSPLGGLPGRSSPIGDIMAMASFFDKDELHDMFSQDKNFNFIPIIQQNAKEEQEVKQFIDYLNRRSEEEKELLEAAREEFDIRGQRSLNTKSFLGQQIENNGLQNLAQQNPLQRLTQQNGLLQSGINQLLPSQNLRQSGIGNPTLSQQNPLQRSGIHPLLALQAQKNAIHGSGFNPLFALHPQQNSLQLSDINPLLTLLSQLQSSPKSRTNESFISQLQTNQAFTNDLGLNPLVHQALLKEARVQGSLQPQSPQLAPLQQLILRQARDAELLREREISANLPVEHKQEPFRFPRD